MGASGRIPTGLYATCEYDSSCLDENIIIHQELLLKETTMHMAHPTVGSITFFQGDMAAAALFLKDRIIHVLALNPWLGGKLAIVNDRVELMYPPKPISLNSIFTVLPNLIENINVRSQYNSLLGACAPLFIGGDGRANGSEQVKAQTIVSRFVIVPTAFSSDNYPDGFALVFSMSHVVGDAYTYFEILNMLSDDSRAIVRALNPVRKPEFEEVHQRRLIGPDTFDFYFNPPIKPAKPSETTLPTAVPLAYLVDQQRVNFAKEAHTVATRSYISTNDIITSHFMNVCKPRLGLMSMNYRSRCPILDSNDAGNYQGYVFYDHDGYQTPATVRAAMSPDKDGAYSGIKKDLPKPGDECRVASITAQAMTGTCPPFDLSLAGKVRQVLHLPLNLMLTPQSDWLHAIVFRPLPTKLAVLVHARGVSSETLLTGNHPFGLCVNLDMFPHSGPF